jgi:hypothetical protein
MQDSECRLRDASMQDHPKTSRALPVDPSCIPKEEGGKWGKKNRPGLKALALLSYNTQTFIRFLDL